MEDLTQTLKALPHEPGVYLYRNADREVIYVGKAVDLSRRVRQYFQSRDAVGEKTRRLVSDIEHIDIIPTTSEFDALLLEAKLIRQYLPKYNVISKDDKSPLYVVLTLSEPLPRLLLVRKSDLPPYEAARGNAIYGPFQSGFTLRNILRQLRRIVPYCTQKERRGNPCFYTHLGLCDPCPGVIVRLQGTEKTRAAIRYRRNFRRLHALFEGRLGLVAGEYERDMRKYAAARQFEQAAAIRDRLAGIKLLSSHRYDPQVFLEQGAEDIYAEELSDLRGHLTAFFPNLSDLHRIECIDISNLSGTHAVGSLVVLQHGKPDTASYRRFRIRSVRGISDVAMIREVVRRRLAHPEWPYPDLLLIDGGKPQVAAADGIVHRTFPLAGLAKREEEVIIPIHPGFSTLRLPLSGRALKVLMRIRDEAHRFAITYHKTLRTRAFVGATSKSRRLTDEPRT